MAIEDLQFFNPLAGIRMTGGRLPHWEQPGATYFLTFRLADALPASIRAEWQVERDAWIANHSGPWQDDVEQEFHRLFTARVDAWLDAGNGACVLRNPECRRALEESLRHGDCLQYCLHAWVIMPNHVHAVVSLRKDQRLNGIVGAWKSVSARRINQGNGSSGTLWQENYFDRLVRDAGHFANCLRYIRRNPEKASLTPGEFTLFENPLARQFLE